MVENEEINKLHYWYEKVYDEMKREATQYTNRETLFKKMLEYFKGDELAANVFIDKYVKTKNVIREHGVLLSQEDNTAYRNESVDGVLERIANAVYEVEKKYGKPKENIFTSSLKEFKYLVPAGSIISGLSKENNESLANCFVIGGNSREVIDSYGQILRIEEEMVQVEKRRGGAGIDLTFIRPSGEHINNAAKQSSGPVLFAKRFSNAIKEVAQAGRRGALMLSLDISHPDAEKFINAKTNTNEITGANISLKVHDDAIESLLNENNKKEKALRRLRDWNIAAMLKEEEKTYPELMKLIAKNIVKYAEPGILFFSRVGEGIDAEFYRELYPNTTNPCGELWLSDKEECKLASLNLFSFVKNPFTENAEFDYELFARETRKGIRFLDDINDIEIERLTNLVKYLEQERDSYYNVQKDASVYDVEINLWKKVIEKIKLGRRIGLGWLGFADMLAALGYKYDSEESRLLAINLTEWFAFNSFIETIQLAKERGPFELYKKDNDIFGPGEYNSEATYLKARIKHGKPLYGISYIDKIYDIINKFDSSGNIIKDWIKYGRRNVHLMSIAPTGSIAILAQVSSGIEPVFNLRYSRKRRAINDDNVAFVDENGDKWEEFTVIHGGLKKWYEIKYPDSKPIEKLSEKEFKEVVRESPYYGSTAHEIDPFEKIALIGAIQSNGLDGNISNTLNMPKGTTEETMLKAIIIAWESGLKGFTAYVDGSRTDILSTKKHSDIDAKKRPKMLNADIHTTAVKGESWLVIVGMLNNMPYEVFAFKNNNKFGLKNGDKGFIFKRKGKVYDLLDPTQRVIVHDLVSNFETPEEEFGTRLISTALRHGTDVKFLYEQLQKSKGDITSFSKAIARVLAKYTVKESSENCPHCGSKLTFEEGCLVCKNCGYSKCG